MPRTKKLAILASVLVAGGVASADSPLQLPAVGAMLGENPTPWPKMEWLYDQPSATDAAGKIVVHWFCGPKIPACADDLSRMIAERDTGKVYIVAHINGGKSEAKKFDPIQESEGVGKGTVAFGRGVASLMKSMGIVGPASIVINVDGKVAMVSTGSSSAELDDRDKKIDTLAAAIKEYTVTSEGPKMVKVDEKFTLAMSIRLASWLHYSPKRPPEFVLTAPGDVKCDAMKLAGDQIKIEGDKLTASVTCSAAKGSYELRGQLRFGFDQPSGGQGMGAEDTRWTLSVSAGLGK